MKTEPHTHTSRSDEQYQTAVLSNGIRVIVGQAPTDAVYCGVAVDSGTRDELPHESGLAHFTEHLSFKGTPHRKAWHILNRMESVGGDLNAYTGKEETVYYCTTLLPHLERAIDLLVDITLASTFPQTEIEKEVEVVIDEIESAADYPSDLIYDDFESLLFEGHPLGRNILGEADRLRGYVRGDICNYVNRQYHTSRMVLYVLGRADINKVVRYAERAIRRNTPLENPICATRTDIPTRIPTPADLHPSAATPSSNLGRRVVRTKDTHQAHVMIGCAGYGALDKRHLALYLLNNILGGPGMNSRLNLALRERNGLVYSVESTLTTYTDTSVWSIYFDCDPADVERCLRLARRELRRLCDAPLTDAALRAAKRQIVGQIGISYDSHENVAIGMAKRYLHYGTMLSRDELCRRVQALTADELWQAAREVFAPERLNVLVYRP